MLGVFGGYYGLWAAFAIFTWYERAYSVPMIFAAELLRVGLPLSTGFLAAWLAHKRLLVRTPTANGEPRSSWPRNLGRLLAVALAIAYALTWSFGVPAAATALTNRTVTAFKSGLAREQAPWYLAAGYPEMTVRFAIPIAPGLVAVYYDSATGGQAGGGGWFFFLWWGVGQRQVGASYRWLS